MSVERFQHIWNQLILVAQFPLAGPPKIFFDAIDDQIKKAREENAITNRQFLVLANASREWRDILEQSTAAVGGEEEESSCQVSDNVG